MNFQGLEIWHIRWLDTGAHVDYGWAPKEKYIADAVTDKMTVDTIGFLMHEDDDIVMVALSHVFDDLWYGAQIIHKSSIVEKRRMSTI